ncbi:EAL domain-containing protein [Rhizobium sp. CFBP 8762]|uniref:putative bifunctional diguanylate cyclase/phosphodiesterase n=1 Tax=Rhizobium sp. CFBP 8762 TaxID=2775279 RepID=UPI00177E504D|nr:EAL domain-containing protein [Rhizobium sp. CFBP 8762]MBD8556107.1 EAL domain-containing protein [Rhizobium sp. CFBP 8762]
MSVKSYPVPENEAERLRALADLALMDTPPEIEFERLAELASRLFKVPIVLISLIERDRQFFKSHVGFEPCGTSRDISFCAHAIMQDDVMIVPDAMADPRFQSNPLVLGPPYIRFYAGQPLTMPGGANIGTVCLIDSEPRFFFSEDDRQHLKEVAALVIDRMEMRRLDFARTISQARFENIAATSPDAIICSNAREEITFWNHAAERLFGYSAEEMSRYPSDIIIPASWRQLYDLEISRLRQGKGLELANRTIELSGLRKDGTEFPAEFSLSTWPEGNTAGVGAIVRDMTERKANEERLFRLASLDTLTDLPNRAAWRETLAKTLESNRPASLLLLDLDGFKEVNDTLGHSAGDAVLKEVALRLRDICSDALMVARLGGDEFVALLPGNTVDAVSAIAAQLVDAISQPYDFAGEMVDIGVSIGIALAPVHGFKPEELLGAADIALYKAKAGGRRRFEVFTPAFREVVVARRAFEKELKQAFDTGQFELYYQPQVLLETGSITGAEALIRWNHPTRGLLSPVSFIDVLSHKPSAPAIGEWILKTACLQAARWREMNPNFRVGVNLFEAQFRSGKLATVVEEALAQTHLPADNLELEIVENILLHNDRSTLKLLQDLRAMNVHLAFDDYGTGYASLSLLKRFPVTRLKIDRSFIRNVMTDEEDAAVVKVVIYLAKSFGMEVIAEGVEQEDQRAFLADNGCREAQGYLFGKPMSAADFTDFLEQGTQQVSRAADG